jgi:hypothetical protein
MKTAVVFMLALLPVFKIAAQPFTLDEKIQPIELVLEEYKKDDPKAKGRMVTHTARQEADTAYYWVQGLSMYSPTFFTITASDPAADIKINLCKENWLKPHKTGEIKGKGKWKSDFKTEGDFGIQVIVRKKPVRYALLVWSGDEVKVELPSPFKGGSGAGGKGWLQKNMILVIVIIAALAIIGFLLYKNKKGKK